MVMGMVLSVAHTLFAALQSKELRELCSKFKYESKLENLQGTVETIKNVLLDVESGHQELSHQGLDWVNRLKDAVYDADDLFDEFVTIAQRQKMQSDDEIFDKVSTFLKNYFLFAFSTSRKIKKIREKLDSVSKDHAQFGFSDVYRPVKRKESTSSFVNEHYIFGRDEDKEVIMGMLLKETNYSSIDNVSFVSIVGMGGLGKTALAQLVYNDAKIDDEFDLKLWVCVSDEFIIEEILGKLLKSATQNGHGDIGVDEVQNKLRQHIQGKKYILVLDDLWSESRDEWLKLRAFLQVGARGSRVVVTTRSIKVAEAIGKDPKHPLKGLKDDDSWRLFKTIAFNQGSGENDDDDLVDIGKDIVKKCANVPLAIRVLGSMLYGQHKREWELFQRIKLSEIMEKSENSIMPVLKFSYHRLKPQLKSCFSYCAIFPKDYEIKKELLIHLWSAQGYLEPIDDMQNIEDVGEEYFSILEQRCFLQDIKKDEFGEISSFKMHDLIHDLAQEIAGKESYLMEKTSKSPLEGKIRHVAISDVRQSLLHSPSDNFGKLRGLRTLLYHSFLTMECELQVATILAKCRCLRVLDLHRSLGLKALPNTIKSLLHLRYLDISHNDYLKTLPESITKLYNLQVLNLSTCRSLIELPKDLRELVNLRHLDTTYCRSLTHMPAGMDSMTRLCTLAMFVLGPESSNKAQIGELRDLMPLINLRGTLEIELRKGYAYDSTNVGEELFVSNKKHIKTLSISEEGWRHKETILSLDERLLERLKPHRDLRKISICGYKGITLPRWATTMEICLPRLLRISMFGFHSLQHLPALSQLQHLKDLTLVNMPNVEFMENNDNKVALSFPSLETLCLEKCPSLKSFPRCPHVKIFRLCCLNEALEFCQERDNEANATTHDASSFIASSSSSNDNNNSAGVDVFDLRKLESDSFQVMKSLFRESIRSIDELILHDDKKVESLSSVVQDHHQRKYALSIDKLEFRDCVNLKSMLGGGLGQLTNLKTLCITRCLELELEQDEKFPWKDLVSLYRLELSNLPQMIDIPKGIQYLTSLRTLNIQYCWNMKAHPEWIHCPTSLRSLSFYYNPMVETLPEAILPSLTSLTIGSCDGLKKKYSKPNGTHLSQISHIPNLQLSF